MAASGERTLRFRTGGWVIVLAVLVWLAALAWWLLPLDLETRRPLPHNGFDLTTCLVPVDSLVSSTQPRDGIRSLDDPDTLTVEEVPLLNEQLRGKYLVDTDEVIGVRVGGEARAYPVRVLNWHEIVNDTLGDRPVVVTFSPLTFGIAVFDRAVGDRTMEFGVSGLLHQSGLVIFDRGGESLWSPIQARALSGPPAKRGEALEPLPFSLTTWGTWKKRHPESTVIAPLLDKTRHYSGNPYGNYYQRARPRFPVDPLPETDEPGLMTRVLAVRSHGEDWSVVLLDPAAGKPTLPGYPVSFGLEREAIGFLEEAEGGDLETMVALWFAWHATHPGEAPRGTRP